MNGKEMKEADKGKAIKNLHYVGDKIWNFKG
jgi:PUA domain protein